MQEPPGKNEASENVCAGCLNVLDEEDIICALNQEWHMECFRCSACDAALSNWYFEKDGLLFCKDDYWARYGESCQQCSQIITGPVMVAGEHKFHPECFCCGSCGAFIGDGDSYALVERSKLYCGQCYKRQMQPLKKTARWPFARKPHSIRLVEIPGGQKGIKLSNEALHSTNSQCFTISEPPFEVMEVWLESLSMHLSVGMPLPPDLLFDIQHYRGVSPSSSGSTTPEGIPSGHRSPALEPIREGKLSTISGDNLKPLKVSSTENLIKPTIKVSSVEDLLLEDTARDFPDYENIDFLKNDCAYAVDVEKSTQKATPKIDTKTYDNNNKDNKFNVQLRKVPKNFTRNRFVKEEQQEPRKPEKNSNLSLQSIGLNLACPSRVTQKFVNSSIVQKNTNKKSIPDVVSSTLNRPSCSLTPKSNHQFSVNIFKKPETEYNLSLSRRRCMRDSGTPIFQRRTQKPTGESASGSLVRNIIENLNRNDRDRFGNPKSFGRCSLRVVGNKKVDVPQGRSSPEEFTNL